MTLVEAMNGTLAPDNIRSQMVLLSILYWGFDEQEHAGQLVVCKDVSNEVQEIFHIIFEAKFPIEKMIPISEYEWSDEMSADDNNSSAFNYRFIYKTDRLSIHSFGRAIDVNPMQNPYIAIDGSVHPETSAYNPLKPGTILDGDIVVRTFERFGWEWGGRWTDRKDYQHFQKIEMHS